MFPQRKKGGIHMVIFISDIFLFRGFCVQICSIDEYIVMPLVCPWITDKAIMSVKTHVKMIIPSDILCPESCWSVLMFISNFCECWINVVFHWKIILSLSSNVHFIPLGLNWISAIIIFCVRILILFVYL